MKKIGIFMGDITQNYQKVVLQAIFSEAGRFGYTVFCFANFGAYGDKVLYAEGERGIVYLPELSELDGIIVGEDTFNVEGMGNEVYEYLKQNVKCPVVYLRLVREAFYHVVMDEEEAICEMTRHFIHHHGFRDICFMAGDFERLDARKRYQGFLNVMQKEGIEVTDHMVFFGDYWREKGKEAVDWFLEGRKEGTYPQAIICSNDYMAISVCDELQRRGIRIPEDVCVSGYDDVVESREYRPPITTVRVPFAELGKSAVRVIDNLLNGRTQSEEVKYVPTMCYRQSCGCPEHNGRVRTWEWMQAKFDTVNMLYNQSLFLNADYQDAVRGEEYLKVAQRYFGWLGCSKGYLCLCVEEEQEQDGVYSGGYTETMVLRRIFTKDGSAVERDEQFPRKQLLPASCLRTLEGKSLIVFSIHFKNRNFGYLALVVEAGEWPTRFDQAYMMALSLAIENVSVQKEIADLEQFKNLYHRDPLTGLFNRRGYEHSLRTLYSKSKEEKKQLTIVSIDMDGLKYINDNFGHAAGDEALCSLAMILAELVREDEICARTGGDEFMMLLYYDKEGREKALEKELYQLLKEENERKQRPYPLHASIGWCCVNKSGEMSLTACTNLADSRMYEHKKAYKESLKH